MVKSLWQFLQTEYKSVFLMIFTVLIFVLHVWVERHIIDNIKTDIDELQADVVDIKSDVADLKTSVNRLLILLPLNPDVKISETERLNMLKSIVGQPPDKNQTND